MIRQRIAAVAGLAPALLAGVLPVRAAPPSPAAGTAATAHPTSGESSGSPSPPPSPLTVSLCQALEAAAARNGLPAAFFTRLIWQESRFDPGARSPVGALGVAQFMPATAADRGLVDPLEPARALDESAAYLRELRGRFGNLGLAAAAYNAGPGRVSRWLAGVSGLPGETQSYVAIVTGRSVEDWRAPATAALAPEPGFSCLAFAGDAGRRRTLARLPEPTEPGLPAPKAWAVIIYASFNRVALTAEYAATRARLARIFDAPKPLPPAARAAVADATAAATPSGTSATLPAEPTGVPVPLIRRRHLGGEPARKFLVQLETDNRADANALCKRFHGGGGNCIVLRNLLR